MRRRHFLKLAGAASLGLHGLHAGPVAAAFPSVDYGKLFEAGSPELLALAQRVMDKCVVAMLREPVPPLARTWIAPGGPHYIGQWIWDTMFVLDLLSILPGRENQIRDVFRNYWDFQDRWNAREPEFMHHMITVAIKPHPLEERRFSQIALLAWGMERVFRRNGDRVLLDEGLERLERFHEWYWRERDLHGKGLVTVGSYSGIVQHARWETFDHECNMDALTLTPHPTRKGAKEGAWYGDLCVPGNTAYLILAERSLERLAQITGNSAMAERRRKRIEQGVQGMRAHMWDEQAGAFLTVKRDTLEKLPVVTIGSWIPLVAGVPTEDQARRMAEVLASPRWQTPLPVATVDPQDPRWKSGSFWRGDVWPATNYQIATGLAAYGHRELAAAIADKTVANALRNGLSERYDSVSGKGLGVPDYSMDATILMMMLDGLTRQHAVKLR
ncbi:MAG TPA: trehalase family glycosidase [Luteolibacter sp.]|nr:trehalase family glycosidase [Luteolibacter sp.]